MSKLIYCATPARLNIKRQEIMDFVTQKGYRPLHPFQAFEYERFEGGPIGREKTIEFCKRLVDISDEFWMFGISEGTLAEYVHALKIEKPIKLLFETYDPEWRQYYQKLAEKYQYPLEQIAS